MCGAAGPGGAGARATGRRRAAIALPRESARTRWRSAGRRRPGARGGAGRSAGSSPRRILEPIRPLLPFPGQEATRAALEKQRRLGRYLSIDRAARTFYLLEGRYPAALDELVAPAAPAGPLAARTPRGSPWSSRRRPRPIGCDRWWRGRRRPSSASPKASRATSCSTRASSPVCAKRSASPSSCSTERTAERLPTDPANRPRRARRSTSPSSPPKPARSGAFADRLRHGPAPSPGPPPLNWSFFFCSLAVEKAQVVSEGSRRAVRDRRSVALPGVKTHPGRKYECDFVRKTDGGT